MRPELKRRLLGYLVIGLGIVMLGSYLLDKDTRRSYGDLWAGASLFIAGGAWWVYRNRDPERKSDSRGDN